MRIITAQIAVLVALLALGAGCGKEKVDGRLSIQFVSLCHPSLDDLASEIDSYCILVERSDGQTEPTENCSSSLDSVKLKVDAYSSPVRVVVEGRSGSEVIARGRSVPVMLTSGEKITLEIPIAPAREFGLLAADRQGCSALPYPAIGHTATVFPSGHVLVIGSKHANVPSSRAAFMIDPMNSQIDEIATPGSLHRGDHTATMLDDGRVVVIGGLTTGGLVQSIPAVLRGGDDLLQTYDPEVDYLGKIFFEDLPDEPESPRGIHNASRFWGDRVLFNDGQSTAELFIGRTERSGFIQIVGDPDNPFPLTGGRIVTVVPLDQERAVIMGGEVNHSGMIIVSSERLEVEFMPFSLPCGMRDNPRGLILPSKQVMFLGGGSGALILREPVVVVDPTVSPVSLAAVPVQDGVFPVHSFTASVLPDGRVVVAGGDRSTTGNQFQPGSTFVIEPRGDNPEQWTVLNGPRMNMPRAGHTASVLPDNRLLMIGGYSADPGVSDEAVAYSAEIIAF